MDYKIFFMVYLPCAVGCDPIAKIASEVRCFLAESPETSQKSSGSPLLFFQLQSKNKKEDWAYTKKYHVSMRWPLVLNLWKLGINLLPQGCLFFFVVVLSLSLLFFNMSLLVYLSFLANRILAAFSFWVYSENAFQREDVIISTFYENHYNW